jgi:hypothetical protein
MTGSGGTFGGSLSTTWRECECGIKALFYSVGKDYELKVSSVYKDAEKNRSKEREKLLSVFLLADIDVEKSWNIENGYYGREADWLLVKTDLGLITIGWRKRVISIDWAETGISYLVEDNVTKEETMCHAYSYDKAVRYLRGLKEAKPAQSKSSFLEN